MRNWVSGTIKLWQLTIVLAIALAGAGGTHCFKTQQLSPYYLQQVEAAATMERAMALLKQLRLELGIPLDPELDPNQTGLIGYEYSDLTTTLGVLESKRTTTNPVFAALMVQYFHELGLRAGDTIAIGASGSFPALILATLSAAQSLELEPLVVYSLGASMYGANIPGFTYVEMHLHLLTKGLFAEPLTALSMGGDDDRTLGALSNLGQDDVRQIAEHLGVTFIYEKDLTESIGARLNLYQQLAAAKGIRCFVNIGGAAANFGNTPASLKIPNGVVRRVPIATESPERGLIFEYLVRGVPVINLLNVRELASKNGIPIDPVPIPKVAEGSVYHVVTHPRWPAIIGILSTFFILFLFAAQSGRPQKW